MTQTSPGEMGEQADLAPWPGGHIPHSPGGASWVHRLEAPATCPVGSQVPGFLMQLAHIPPTLKSGGKASRGEEEGAEAQRHSGAFWFGRKWTPALAEQASPEGAFLLPLLSKLSHPTLSVMTISIVSTSWDITVSSRLLEVGFCQSSDLLFNLILFYGSCGFLCC